jgi:hypothetical protein
MITKEHALQIYFDHEKDMIKITDEPLSETTQIYGYGKDEDCWYLYPPGPLVIGARRVVIISKKDGRILFDGNIGE